MKSFHIKFRFWLSTRRFVGRGGGALLVGHYRILVSTYSCLDIVSKVCEQLVPAGRT